MSQSSEKKQLFLGRQHAIKCQKVFFSSFFAIWHFVKSMKLIRYLITTYLSAYLPNYLCHYYYQSYNIMLKNGGHPNITVFQPENPHTSNQQ